LSGCVAESDDAAARLSTRFEPRLIQLHLQPVILLSRGILIASNDVNNVIVSDLSAVRHARRPAGRAAGLAACIEFMPHLLRNLREVAKSALATCISRILTSAAVMLFKVVHV
jgi:hypothetical protein